MLPPVIWFTWSALLNVTKLYFTSIIEYGGREGGREGGKEGGMVGGREGVREGGERGREDGRTEGHSGQRGVEEGTYMCPYHVQQLLYYCLVIAIWLLSL